MKLLRQWALIIAVCFLGEILQRILHIPIPGNVLGMVLLFILLFTKVIKVEFLEESAKFLLDHLAFFFIPPSVSLMTNLELLQGNMIKFILVCFISTIIVMVVTGHVVQFLNKITDKLRK